MLKDILEIHGQEGFMIADGFDEAVIGIDLDGVRLVYSVKKCLEILIQKEGMTQEEALEHFCYNVSGGWVGDQTPIWCWDKFDL